MQRLPRLLSCCAAGLGLAGAPLPTDRPLKPPVDEQVEQVVVLGQRSGVPLWRVHRPFFRMPRFLSPTRR